MTFGKASALTLGFVGAFGLGVWIGPQLTKDRMPVADHQSTQAPTPALELAPSSTTAPASTAQPKEKPAVRRDSKAAAVTLAASEPSLHTRLKPLLNRGANMNVAAEGFHDGEQFAALAHAARNTEIPFMLLKYRVVDQRQTLASAIHESKPKMNAAVEANRATAEAKADIAALRG